MIPQVKNTCGMPLLNAGISLSQQYILRTLVESKPGRVKAILKSKGGRTK
jgi:hypothetical protein